MTGVTGAHTADTTEEELQGCVCVCGGDSGTCEIQDPLYVAGDRMRGVGGNPGAIFPELGGAGGDRCVEEAAGVEGRAP